MRTVKAGLIMLLLALSGATPASAADNAPLRVSLETASPSPRGDIDIPVRVTITNPNPNPVTVPVWQVPVDDIPTPLLQVTAADGSRAPYVGPLIKWSRAALDGGVTFAPHQSRVFMIELSPLYDIGNGRYRIDYSQDGPGRYDRAGRTARVFGSIAPMFINTSGRSSKKVGNAAPAPEANAPLLKSTLCSSSQQAAISAAMTGATIYAAGANSYFGPKHTASRPSPRYVTWFGAATAARWDHVRNDFLAIYSAFTTQQIDVDCSCKQKKVYAYTYPNKPYSIYVCGAFWTAPATGTDSKAGTLIHEMSHFTVVAGTQDYAYGQTAAQSLASTDPDKAINNADSHEYFAENTPALP